MPNERLLVGSHAPFWHCGRDLRSKNLHIMLAAAPAVLMGLYRFGAPALGVLALAVSSAILWELLANRLMKRPFSAGDGNAALIGLLLGMLLPATTPWWAVVVGTFAAIVVGKQIYGGLGCNPFNPTLVAMAMMLLSWKLLLNFDAALVDYEFGFHYLYPPAALKHFGPPAGLLYPLGGLLMGAQTGGVGATFGLGLILGGLYLVLRGFVRWEISLSFLAAVFVTALLFHLADPAKYISPAFHLLTGYTLIGAFFLAPEDSSSPVNFVPMLIYGAAGGVLAVLIRNIGAFPDGVVFALLMMNVANPMIDKLRPRAMGKGVQHA